MKRAAVTLAVFGASLAITAPRAGAVDHRARSFAFRATTTARTIEIPGRAKNWNLMLVSVNGNSGTMWVDDQSGDTAFSTYGHGVALRFAQRGQRAFITAVALTGHPRVVVTYWLS